MIRNALSAALLLFLVSEAHSSLAQAGSEIHGEVFHLGENSERIYETGIVVTWLETGSSSETNDQGWFRLPTPPFSRPGDKVTLNVAKPHWRIRYPLDGETLIAASPSALIKIELLPAGSRLFWTNDRIEKFIRDTAERAKRDAETRDRQDRDHGRQSADFARYLEEWAYRYGFTPEDAQRELDRWIAETEKNHEDHYRLGLADLAQQRFAAAARHFRDSAEWRARHLAEIRRRRETLTEREAQVRNELIRDLRLEGDSDLQTGDYAEALAVYVEAHGYTSRDETADLWATTLDDIAQAHLRLGTLRSPAESASHLQQAVQSDLAAGSVFTREKHPQDWARVQRRIAVALFEQALRTDGERSAKLLAETIETLRQALLVTRAQDPQDWAAAQNNLGNTLQEQGRRSENDRAVRLLTEAIVAYREALSVRTPEQFPEDWAGTESNLGNALSALGRRTEGELGDRLLSQGIEAFRQAMSVNTPEHLPREWARMQSNIGATLQMQGKRTNGARGDELLTKAAEADRRALLVYDHEDLPQDRARVESNLGMTLHTLAERATRDRRRRLLAESIDASHKAVSVYTREELPLDWARTLNTLGGALQDLGEMTEGEPGVRLIAEALKAYRSVLLVRTREQRPRDWAWVHSDIGDSLLSMGIRTEGEDASRYLAEAAEAYSQAIEVYTYEHDSKDWTSTRISLVRALLLEGRDQEGAERLIEILSRRPVDSTGSRLLSLILTHRLFGANQSPPALRRCPAFNPRDPETRLFEIEGLFAVEALQRSVEPASTDGLTALVDEIAGLIQELQAHRQAILYRDWIERMYMSLKTADRNRIIEGLSLLEAELMAAGPPLGQNGSRPPAAAPPPHPAPPRAPAAFPHARRIASDARRNAAASHRRDSTASRGSRSTVSASRLAPRLPSGRRDRWRRPSVLVYR